MLAIDGSNVQKIFPPGLMT